MNRFREWYRSNLIRPMVLAHRGDSFHAPENTLEAGRLGFEAGADGWELDVHRTKDGVPIVLHDESLRRTTDVARRFAEDHRGDAGFLVGEFRLDEVRTLDAGSWFVDAAGGPRSAAAFGTLDQLGENNFVRYTSTMVRVPTLAEALELTTKYDKLLNIEIKPSTDDPDGLVAAVLDEVRAHRAIDRVAISSFDHDIVAAVARIEPGVATGALVSGLVEGSAGDLLKTLGADAVHCPPSGAGMMTHHRVPVLVYTVNDAEPDGLAERLIKDRVAGIFTDDPSSLATVLGIIPSSVRTKAR